VAYVETELRERLADANNLKFALNSMERERAELEASLARITAKSEEENCRMQEQIDGLTLDLKISGQQLTCLDSSILLIRAENSRLRSREESLKRLFGASKGRCSSLELEVERLRTALERSEKSNRQLKIVESRLKILSIEDLGVKKKNDQLEKEVEELKRQLVLSKSGVKVIQLERNEALEARRIAEVEVARYNIREMLAEEEARKKAAELEEMRRQAAEKAKEEREEAERRAREKEEREREEREAQERLRLWKAATDKERARCRQRDKERWGTGAWTSKRSLERFKILVEEFESIKFSESQPLTCESIPWPSLADPMQFRIGDVNWSMVDSFFAAVAALVPPAEYRRLVEKIHRMFHPDRWRGRSILKTVMDEDLRESLEVAGNQVAQAMTPLWRQSKDMI